MNWTYRVRIAGKEKTTPRELRPVLKTSNDKYKRAMPIAGILRTNNGEAFLRRTLCMFVINYETLLGHGFFLCFFLRLHLPTVPISFDHLLQMPQTYI